MSGTATSLWSPLRWCKTTWPVTLARQVLLLARFAAWIVSSAVSLAVTLVMDVLYPFAIWMWSQVVSFAMFYFPLLWGDLSVSVFLFAPLLVVFFAWMWWVFWLQVSCWLEVAWPVFRTLLDFSVATVGAMVSVFNSMIRLFNTFLPVLGMVIYNVAAIMAEYYRFIVLLIGDLNLSVLFDGFSQIMVYMAEITINLIEASISLDLTILTSFASVIGATASIIMETAPVLLNVTVIVMRILPATIGPILGETAKVVSFVMRTFFKRSDVAFGADGPDPYLSRQQLGLWRSSGELRSTHWTPETATRAERYVDDANGWLSDNPLGVHSTYDMYHNNIPMRRPADVLAAERNRGRRAAPRPGANDTASARPARGARLFATAFAPDEAFAFERAHAEAMRHDYAGPVPSPDELAAETVCRSRFCGGEGAPVRHPLHTIARTHRTDRTRLSREAAPATRAEHAERHRHVAASLHAARLGLASGLRSMRRGSGHMRRHLAATWRALTGHDSVHAAAEAALSRHPDPLDSVLAHMPVLSDMWPFHVMVDMLPPEERDTYWGPWVRKRALFYRDVHDASSDTVRRMVHVSLHEMNATRAAEAFDLRARPTRGHARRQAGLGQGAMSIKYGEPLSVELDGGGQVVQASGGVQSAGFLDDFGRGATSLLGGAVIGGPAFAAGALAEAAMPMLKMLYTRDCFSEPKHPWCIPEVPQQLYCIFINYVRMIPRNLPVRLCKYEEECAAIGFCIPRRPTPVEIINPITAMSFAISWCWVQNMAVYLVTLLGMIFPVVRLNLRILEVTVPFLGPWIFGPLWRIIPEPISLQDGVCLVDFLYAPMLLLVSLYYWRFAAAIFTWALSTGRRFLDLLGAARAAALERREALANEPWYQELLARRTAASASARLSRDRAYAYLAQLGRPPVPTSPFAPTPEVASRPPGAGIAYYPAGANLDPSQMLRQDVLDEGARDNIYATVPMPSQQPVEAQIGAALPERPPHPHELEALRDALAAEAAHFGHPPPNAVQLDHVFDHVARWHPLIHSAHYSASWLETHYLPHHPSLRPGAGTARSPLRYVRSLAHIPEGS